MTIQGRHGNYEHTFLPAAAAAAANVDGRPQYHLLMHSY